MVGVLNEGLIGGNFRMAYVFLSHAHEDKPFARKRAGDLRREGHAVWLDEAEIKIGDSLIDKISEGLKEVDYVAAVLSHHSVQSPWVAKELEVASNREISERRVVVLPLLIDDVEMPGFLVGKLYGDFRNDEAYDDTFDQVLRALGPVEKPPEPDQDEIKLLKEELKLVRQMAKREAEAAKRAGDAAFQAKSPELKAAIEKANAKFPAHAPINKTFAFQIDNVMITLDYALWAVMKASSGRGHPLEMLLTIEERWSDLENMMEAYLEMIEDDDANASDKPAS